MKATSAPVVSDWKRRKAWRNVRRGVANVTGANRLMAVPIEPGKTFRYGQPRGLFDGAHNFGIESGRSYDVNPANVNEYKYQGRWEPMRVTTDTVAVKGEKPVTVELKHTRHGPVIFEDAANHKAYALRAAWMEPGSAPYLASLRMNQARTWEEFREACGYSRMPAENMVWVDRTGTIGWQAAGIQPLRRNWSGLLPVPGDGRYEWDGYLPITALPHEVNPPSIVANGINDRHRDDVFQSKQTANNDRPVRPRACQRDVQMIPSRLGLETRGTIRGDAIAKPIPLTDERAVSGGLRGELRRRHGVKPFGLPSASRILISPSPSSLIPASIFARSPITTQTSWLGVTNFFAVTLI